MTTNFNNIIKTYNENEQTIIRNRVIAYALAGSTAAAPETEAEFKAFCEETIRNHNENEAKEAAKKAAAKERKVARDLANGITPEMRKAMTYARRYENKIAELEKELAELKAKKAYWDEKAKG